MQPPASMIAGFVRQAIRDEIDAVFHHPSDMEPPVARSMTSRCGPGSLSWLLHDDVTSMMVGGVASLLLQMLHPAALAGIWDHSRFRHDMQGRLRRTARFMAITTFASRAEAEAAVERVRAIHQTVSGRSSDGAPYSAADPALLAWVHACQIICQLAAWRRYGHSALSIGDEDRYVEEAGWVARALGADPVPASRFELDRVVQRFRPSLRVDERTREVARFLLGQRTGRLRTEPLLAVTLGAGVDLLPGWAAHLHGLAPLPLVRPLVRSATHGIAGILRWALADPAQQPSHAASVSIRSAA